MQNPLQSAKQYQQLWITLLPQHEAPEMSQFVMWAGTYPDALITRGIARAASKAQKLAPTAPMTAEDAAKYASSVMRNESLGIRQHGSQRAA